MQRKYITIVRGKNNYNLKPLPEPQKEREPLAIIVGEKEMLKVIKEEKEGYALILKPRDETLPSKDKSIPKEVQNLLEEYKEVIAKDLPSSLPPIRNISHQIDFILGASFPNKAPYKLTPTQNVEISK